jgi:hypothetical protein
VDLVAFGFAVVFECLAVRAAEKQRT